MIDLWQALEISDHYPVEVSLKKKSSVTKTSGKTKKKK